MSVTPTIAMAPSDSARVLKRCEGERELRAGCDDMQSLLSRCFTSRGQRPGRTLRSVATAKFWRKNRDETASGFRRRMRRDPMPRDLLAPADPDAGVPPDVVEKTLEPGGAGGMADLPKVQAHRHHLGRALAFAVEQVEGVAAEAEEVVGGREDSAAEFRVVVGKRVRHHEMRSPAHVDPARELVVVGVAVLAEPPFLSHPPPRFAS